MYTTHAHTNPGALVMLHIVREMYSKLPALIKEASGEGDTVGADVVSRARHLGMLWSVCRADGTTGINTAVARAVAAPSVAFKGSMQRLFKSEVEAMATASRHAFTVHIALCSSC